MIENDADPKILREVKLSFSITIRMKVYFVYYQYLSSLKVILILLVYILVSSYVQSPSIDELTYILLTQKKKRIELNMYFPDMKAVKKKKRNLIRLRKTMIKILSRYNLLSFIVLFKIGCI